MAAIDSAYQYYLSTYGNSTVSRYDTHKKSQLRDTYNKIVKTNKESPLYKIKETKNAARFAIDIKESARQIQNVISSLSGGGKGIEAAFSKKVASSTDDEMVEAKYIGANDESEATESFDIEVRSLAEPQVNQSNFLYSGVRDIPVGNYSFDLNTPSASYEFQFSVNDGETNRDILNKLARLINSANLGLKTEILENDNRQSALRLESSQTGLPEGEQYLFNIVPEGTTDSRTAMGILGISEITSPAKNASFLLNGKEHVSRSNTITVDKTFELKLKGIHNEGESETIGYKPSVDAVADNLQELVDSYNSIIDIATNPVGEEQQGNRLLNDMRSVTLNYNSELEAIGLCSQDDGRIKVDRALLADAISSVDAKESFSVLNAFKDALNDKASNASINPMNYVNKIIVAYKNPGHNFAAPYISSIYAGMMLDRRC